MARTKKEIEEQAPDAEQETTGTESDPVPQTEQETPPGEVANAGVTDLELAAAKSLDPDAPQTDLESSDDPDGQAVPPQTDPEWDPDSQSESGQETFSSQTDMESADSNAGSQTDLEPAEEPGDGQAFDPTADLGSQTEPETEPDDKASPQSEGDAAAEGDAEPPAPPRRRRTSRKKAAEVQEAQDGGEDVPAEEEQSESGQPQKLRMPGRRRQRVVSIDAERTVETDTDRLRNDLLDLVESLKSKKILTGAIQGVERLADNPEMSYAVIYHGDFKVIIPVLEAIEEPEDYRGQPKGDVLHYLLNKRLGAEVDYIVKGIDQEHNVVAASRLEAMALKRREYYFRTDRDGNYQIYEGIRAEARVISVIRAGIFVDLFGAECYIPLRELSYQRWVDAAQHYQPGQRVLVRVLEVDRSDRGRPRVTASVKQAMENPYEKALKKYVVGNRYVGTVSMVDLNGRVRVSGRRHRLSVYLSQARPAAPGRQGDGANPGYQPREQPDLGRHHPHVHHALRGGKRTMTIQRRLRVTLLAALCLAMCLCTTAFADTDGTEPKITQQPDQLVLQLGTRWAGVEFELRTDAGVFPAPIIVDEDGCADHGSGRQHHLHPQLHQLHRPHP